MTEKNVRCLYRAVVIAGTGGRSSPGGARESDRKRRFLFSSARLWRHLLCVLTKRSKCHYRLDDYCR
jgi:hypothetical protein